MKTHTLITITPFWKLQTKKQVGLGIGFCLTRFDYAPESFYVLEIDLLVLRIRITIK